MLPRPPSRGNHQHRRPVVALRQDRSGEGSDAPHRLVLAPVAVEGLSRMAVGVACREDEAFLMCDTQARYFPAETQGLWQSALTDRALTPRRMLGSGADRSSVVLLPVDRPVMSN
jgi:hypothetical protein